MLRATRYLVATAGTRLIHTTSQCCDKVCPQPMQLSDTHNHDRLASLAWATWYERDVVSRMYTKHCHITQGMPMATNLIKAGHQLIVHDRTDAASRLASQHPDVVVCAAPSEVASHPGAGIPATALPRVHPAPHRPSSHYHNAPIRSSSAGRLHGANRPAGSTGGRHRPIAHRLVHHRPGNHSLGTAVYQSNNNTLAADSAHVLTTGRVCSCSSIAAPRYPCTGKQPRPYLCGRPSLWWSTWRRRCHTHIHGARAC